MNLSTIRLANALGTLILSFSLFGCDSNHQTNDDSLETETHENYVDTTTSTLEFSNPAVFLGSNFGLFFRSLYGIGDFEQMVHFTADQIRVKYGDDKLMEYYRKLDLRMEMRLLSITKSDSIQFMNYECIDKATKTVRRLPVIIENDSVKVFPLRLEDGTVFEE